MKVSGSYTLAVPRQQVWEALQDPAVLARTIPGCEALEVTGPDAYAATVTAGVASVKGTYQGSVALSDKQVPDQYRMQAHGAGAPGTIRADALIRLADHDGGGTTVSFDADAVVGGMIGGVGQRMLAGVAKKTAGDFFAAVERDLLGVAVPAAAAGAAAGAAAASAEAAVEAGAGPVTACAEALPAAAPAVGQVFAGAPRPAAGTSRLPELLAAFGLGALVALAGVLVGRRLRP